MDGSWRLNDCSSEWCTFELTAAESTRFDALFNRATAARPVAGQMFF